MPLRRLTRFSRIELEKEKDELERTIEALDAILADDQLLRKVVSDELGEVAKTFGTPRRTVLLESAGVTVSAAAASDRGARRPVLRLPVVVRAARPVASDELPSGEGARANHDVIVSAVRTTARGEIGALTSRRPRGAPRRARPPALPGSANHPNLQGGLPFDLVRRSSRRAGAGLCRCVPTGPAWRSAPAWVVKRVNPEVLGKDEWDVIALRDGDEVVGAVELRSGDEELCFITPTRSCCTSAPPASGPRAAAAAACPASSSAAVSPWCGSVRSRRRPRWW
jgi:DNA gyrase subunit A